MSEKLLLTIAEAAALLSLSRATLYELLRKNELRPVRIGRAARSSRAELERYVARLEEAAAAAGGGGGLGGRDA